MVGIQKITLAPLLTLIATILTLAPAFANPVHKATQAYYLKKCQSHWDKCNINKAPKRLNFEFITHSRNHNAIALK